MSEADARRRERIVLTVAVVATAMGFIDANVVAVAIPQLRTSLDASFAQVQWVTNAYLLFLTAFMLMAGGLSDRFGTARVLGAGLAVFTFASGLCTVALDPWSLIAFRALQGLGAAFMVPGSMALVARHTARERRGRAMGIWVGASAVTTSVGPGLGSLFLLAGPDLGWRLVFAVNLPLGALVLWLLATRVPRDRAEPPRTLTGLGWRGSGLDWTGAGLVTAALGLLAIGLTLLGDGGTGEGGATMPLAAIVAGVLLAAFAVRWELRARDPLVDVRLFAVPSFAAANAMTLLVWAGLQAILFYLPMILITAWGRPATHAAAIYLAFGLTIAIMSPLAGRLVDRIGARPLLVAGSSLAALGYAGVGLAVGAGPQWYWSGVLPMLGLMGVGIGLAASPLSAAVMLSVPDEKGGTASGVNNMASRMAGLFAIAGLGALLAFVHDRVVRASDAPPFVRDALVEAGFGERLTGGLYSVVAVEVQSVAMTHAFAALGIAAGALAALGALLALRVRV